MSKILTAQEEEELIHMTSIGEEAKFHKAMKAYEEIPIPEKLNELVHRTIEEHSEKHLQQKKKAAGRRGVIITLRTFGAMAAALLIFFIPLNMNEAFAKQMQQLPVIGKLAEVLTVRSYSYTEDGINVDISVPEIVAETDDSEQIIAGGTTDSGQTADSGQEAIMEDEMLLSALSDGSLEKEPANGRAFEDINAEIQSIVDNYEADAKARFEEYKEAFFATGGTQEEWGDRTCDIDVYYEVTYNEGSLLSLVLTTTESWVAVYGARYYYNLDLESGNELTLQDMLGDDWIAICNDSIVAQIETRLAGDTEETLTYWNYGADAGDDFAEGFTTVNEDTDFYINAAGNPVVCFDKYEIAPGYMGIQEFEITR